MKTTEQYFPVVLFIKMYRMVFIFEAVDEILKRNHSNQRYWAEISCGAVYYGGSILWVIGWNSKVWLIQIKATGQCAPAVLFDMLQRWF